MKAMTNEDMRIEDTDISKIRGKHRQVKLEQVYDMENLIAAEKEARKGKGKKFGVMKFDRHARENLENIQRMLKERTYRRSPAKQEEQDCPCGKRRLLTKLPYYPDHIIDHALMRVIGKTMTRSYYYDSAASIKGKGTEFARRRVRKFLDKNRHRDIVWAKMDFQKFYHNIMQPIVYEELCKMYHNDGIRWLLKEVVTTIPTGLGIGLYPIQPIANFHLNRLDRLVGEKTHGEVHLFRYCDDMLLIGFDTRTVWKAVEEIRRYAAEVICQPLHTNVNVEHVTASSGIDFVGYVFFKEYTLLRKRMKQRMHRKTIHFMNKGNRERLRQVLASYKGWLMHCNGRNLWKKITGMKKFSDLNIKHESVTKDGQVYFNVPTVSCGFIAGREIIVKDYQEGVTTKNGEGRFVVLIEEGGRECKFITNNPRLKDVLRQCREQDAFPFSAMLNSKPLGGNKVDYYFE